MCEAKWEAAGRRGAGFRGFLRDSAEAAINRESGKTTALKGRFPLGATWLQPRKWEVWPFII